MHCPIRVRKWYESTVLPVSCPVTARGQHLVSLPAKKNAAWFDSTQAQGLCALTLTASFYPFLSIQLWRDE